MAAEVQVPSDLAAVIYRGTPGRSVLIVNQSATDVYVDDDPSLLNRVTPGSVPASGTKIAATTGGVLFPTFTGVVWARAAVPVSVQVMPG